MLQAEDIVALEDLLEQLKVRRGIDFTGYKRSSLSRRIRRRMDAIGIASFREYAAHLERTPREYGVLFNSILVNVTAFFRDPESWGSLREQALPQLLHESRNRSQLRVWCAGCASGEEPYTVAMLLAEQLGVEELVRRVKIYATDWDEDALDQARRARYLPDQLEAVPPQLRERYFTHVDGKMVFDGTLRRAVIFGRHDLTEDPPISKLDLLLCRNTLMYFTMATQARVLARLHFALADRGVLFLGRAEMLLSYGHFFAPLELRHRLFVKVSPAAAPVARVRADRALAGPERVEPVLARLRDAALDAGPLAQVVFDVDDRLALFNVRAATLFQLGTAELGKPLRDLDSSYRPVDLRSMSELAREQEVAVTREVERVQPGGVAQIFEITATPLYVGGELVATSVTFDDVTRHHTLRNRLQQLSDDLETAYEELRSANEELETTNEELQSSNEELETTNETLQAANEEMETINEELRSTNEELHSAGERLRAREGELGDANGFLQAILSSLGSGVAVVDASLRIRMWSSRAEEMWGVRADEVRGMDFTALDIGLPVAKLSAPLRDALGTGEVAVAVLDAVNRRGRALRCRVTISPLTGVDPAAATLLMDPIAGDDTT